MRKPESLEELVEAVRAETGQLQSVLRSAFVAPPAMPPRERLEKVNRNLRAAGIILGLRDDLSELQEATERAEMDRDRFERAMRERGVLNNREE